MNAQPLNDGAAPASPVVVVRPWLWALLAAVLTLATYLPALAGEFVWDDTALIEQAPESTRKPSIVDYFTKPFWEPNSMAPEMNLYYRPLVALSYDLDHRVHGLNSAGYRITNFAFHVANVLLLFVLSRRFGSDGLTAGLLSAAWGVFPRLTESVAWISGRTDVFAATFILAAFLLWAARWPNRILASLAVLLGLFCKETAAAGLVALVCFELAQGRKRARDFVMRLSILVVPTLAWLVLKARVSGLFPQAAEHQSLPTRAFMCLEAIGRYPTMVLDWLRPRAEIGIMGKPLLPFVILGGTFVLAAVVFLPQFWRKLTWLQRGLLTGALFALVPVLHFIQLTISVSAADRFLYLPLAFLTLLLSTAKWLRSGWSPRIAVLIVLLSSIPAALASAKNWTNPVDLWSTEYAQSGGACQTCRIELAKLQAEAGDFMPALRMQNSLMRDTAKAGGVPGLVAMDVAILYLRIGEYERARAILTRLVADAPSVPRFWRELATAQAATGHFADAERSVQRAIQLMPSYDKAQAAIDLIRELPGRVEQLSDPDLSQVRRAQTLTAMGRASEAEKLWLQVLQSGRNLPELEAALDFMAEMGSSSVVSFVLATYPQTLQLFPQLAARLRFKDELHRRLVQKALTPRPSQRH